MSLSTGAAGSILGAGLTAAGLQSLQMALNKDSIVNECDWITLLSKAGIGFLGGAITAGAAAGITAVTMNLGSSALQSAAGTLGGYIGLGSATGALGGITSSLASDATRKFVDKDNVTAKQAICRAVSQAIIGATAGALGGLATQSVISHQASKSLEGEMGKQLAIQRVAKSLTDELATDTSREFAESVTKAVMGTATQFVEERLNDEMENQHPLKHVESGIKEATTSTMKVVIKEGSAAIFSQINVQRNEDEYQTTSGKRNCIASADKGQNDPKIDEQTGKSSASFEPDTKNKAFNRRIEESKNRKLNNATNDKNEADKEKQLKLVHQTDIVQQPNDEISSGTFEEVESPKTNFQQYCPTDKIPQDLLVSKASDEKIRDRDLDKGVVSFKTGQNTVTFAFEHKKSKVEINNESSNNLSANMTEMNKSPQASHLPSNKTSNKTENEELFNTTREQHEKEEDYEAMTIKYISEIPGVTKVIATYYLNGEKYEEEVKGSGKRVNVPLEATKVEVRFQVRRFIWWDIMKYNRFEKTWCHPAELHIFRYERPCNRTFTISGNVLGAVTRVSNECHDETFEM